MARIVCVLHDLPLPFGGAASRWYYVLLKGLAERGHELTALAVGGDARAAGRGQQLGALRAACEGADERVLAPAGSDYEDLRHPMMRQSAAMNSSIGMAASDS